MNRWGWLVIILTGWIGIGVTLAQAEEERFIENTYAIAARGYARLPAVINYTPLGSYGWVEPVSDTILEVKASRTEFGLGDDEVAVTRRIREKCKLFELLNPSLLCNPNFLFRLQATPNDAFFSSLYGLQRIGAPTAWDTTTGSSGVKVAIVDTGIQYTHPDLAANVLVNAGETASNGIDDDGNGFIDDVFGYDFANNDGDPNDDNDHGTHCSGTIGAVGNNSTGITGVAWNVKLLGVKVLNAAGSGTLTAVASGIDYARTRGVDVINLSLGGPSNASVVQQRLTEASDQGIFIAVAAGNDGDDNDVTPSFPANYSLATLVSVAATDQNDDLASFEIGGSNYGATKVHLGAPGKRINSTVPGSSYNLFDGTSMAAPHVAGAAALVKAANPGLSGSQIKEIILATTDSVSSLAGKTVTGGRLNVAAAVALATNGTPLPTPSPTPVVTATPTPPTTTPDQTATPEPDPTESPGEGGGDEEEDLALSMSATKVNKSGIATLKVMVFGSESLDPISDEYVGFVCRNRLAGERFTNSAGRASLRAKFRKGTTSCFGVLEDGTRSNVVRVKRR